ncbi:hypothetical protein ABR738_00205 [Streptomyces sp. Edi4]|uniref:hypothetical protein n=1 Tax=Streptomyces sp. Edi4 TaxID=3162527 RepID=UPI00330613CF
MPTTHGVLVRHYDPHPALGRHQVLDARSLRFRHRATRDTLHPVSWQPTIPVLDQQNLQAQHIRTSQLVDGTPDVDALGSCTANAAAAALSIVLDAPRLAAAGLTPDARAAEEWAIRLYADATAADEFTAWQWPPNDAGSSGLGAARALHSRGLIGSYTHILDADALASALQSGPVLLGLPWYDAWFTPGTDAFVDTVPYWRTSGLAGGHEVCALALEEVAQDASGRVIPERTVLRARSSWGTAWGDGGDFRLRLSTYNALRDQIDAIQLHA